MLTVVPLLAAVGLMIRAGWRSFHPKRRPVRQTPESFGMTGERVTVAGADGVRLACWFIPAPAPSDVVVVISHGMGGNSGMFMSVAKTLHDAGYHVFTYDLRNHGNSDDDGRLRGQSPRYAIDHHNVVLSLKDRTDLGEKFRVAMLGTSISSWTALEVARFEPELVRAVICDSGPTLDVVGTLRRMFDATSPRMPRFLRGPLMFAVARATYMKAAVFFLKPAPWPQELGDHTIRVLFIAGENDPVARKDDIQAQLAWYPEADVWFVPNAGHMQSHVVAADEYGKRVLGLLADVFGKAPAD